MNKYTILANFAEQAPCLTTPRPKGPAMKMAGLQVAGYCAAAHSPMTNDHSLFSEQAPSEWHTEIAENCYREARKERKGSLKVFLGALCALAVAIYISVNMRVTHP